MTDYICTVAVYFEYLHHGKWESKTLGFDTSSKPDPLSDNEVVWAACDYYPSVSKESILFMVRIDDPKVHLSDLDAFFEGLKCRLLVDKDFSIGKIIIVNQELFDKYVINTVNQYGGGF